ncbi:GNAT family N-acetyltransferase [Endothiovibrio diazotrophicus]
MDIRIATSAEDREKIFRLRYEVLVEELGWTIAEADHAARRFSEPMDEYGILGGVFDGDRAIGTLRANLARDGSLGKYETLYALDHADPCYPEQTGIITKMLVDKEHRHTLVVPRLLMWVYGLGLQLGIARAYVDCSLDLIPFYEKMGFVTYTDDVETEEYGVIAPMRLEINDFDYLERIRSPFCRALKQFQQGHIDAYLESCGGDEGADFPRGPYRSGLTSERADTHLFDGLDDGALKQVFRAAATKSFADGEAIFTKGDPSWEFGVVLKGRAAVSRTIDGKERVVALFSRGEVLGEMGFLRNVPRSATVTALGGCEIAAFPSAVMERLLQKEPGIAVHLFRNLAIILAERLAQAHDWPGEIQ